MLDPARVVGSLADLGCSLWSGVPDSVLKDLCNYLDRAQHSATHIPAANEGGAIGIGVGHYLASGSVAVVYFQNAGLGNAVNPIASLASSSVYGTPMVLAIGWRGRPGTEDEPQHMLQGRSTIPILDALEVPWSVAPAEQDEFDEVARASVATARDNRSPVAILFDRGMFTPWAAPAPAERQWQLTRESVIDAILDAVPPDAFLVATTGKTGRELYELRRLRGEESAGDFLCIGGMGHASQVGLGMAIASDRPCWVIDGDGAFVMHMGGIASIAETRAPNLKHIVLNNEAHESVGGARTALGGTDIPGVALSVGYRSADRVSSETGLQDALRALAATEGPALLEVRIRTGSRVDLGRPTDSPRERTDRFRSSLER